MKNKIIFICKNNKCGSYVMRAKHIVEKLDDKNIFILFMENFNKDVFKNILSKINNSILIWVKEINLKYLTLTFNKNNFNIYDIVDNYIFNYNSIQKIFNFNLVDCIVVNNIFTKNEIIQNNKYNGFIKIIYHHYDPCFENLILTNQNKLKFGFMGSLPSLYHSNNFIYFDKLVHKFNIEFLNTEDGKYYTENIKNNIPIKSSNQINLSEMEINFNCHISIRESNTDLFKYKTSAKIATAACFGHNIITTYEESVKDLLPVEYPFILFSDDYESICKMFKLVIKDYNSDKVLWNKGLQIMKVLKKKLSIENIINDYNDLFKIFTKDNY
jgi:hypothetical protein